MAYIRTEEVKVIRDSIKKAFPGKQGWKFSVICRHHSEVQVSIMQAPHRLGFAEHSQVNHF